MHRAFEGGSRNPSGRTLTMDAVKTRAGLEQKLYELCLPVVREQGYLLYDLEYLANQKLLRLYIMNPETKSAVIEDCVKVDHALSPAFEAATWVPEEIVLEVSSPGVYRHVNSLAHFQTGLGETHAVTIMGQLDQSLNPDAPKKLFAVKKFRGTLKDAAPSAVTLDTEDGIVKLTFAQIKSASLDPDFNELMKNAKEKN